MFSPPLSFNGRRGSESLRALDKQLSREDFAVAVAVDFEQRALALLALVELS